MLHDWCRTRCKRRNSMRDWRLPDGHRFHLLQTVFDVSWSSIITLSPTDCSRCWRSHYVSINSDAKAAAHTIPINGVRGV